jgi:transcriptional regulator with XRE-family HTH domain
MPVHILGVYPRVAAMTAARDPLLINAFAAAIKSRRATMGWSQEELAWRAGVDRTFIARLESCRNQPSLSVVFALAEALKVSSATLMSDTQCRFEIEQASRADSKHSAAE